MTDLLPIFSLAFAGIADAGVPGLERFAIRPTESVDLGEYIVCLGYQTQLGRASPYSNTDLWFGAVTVDPPAWILIYTGSPPPGVKSEPIEGTEPITGVRLLTYFLRQPVTVFDKPGVVPMLFRFGAVTVGPASVPSPQLAPKQLGSPTT